jgi:hypothetical protein
MKKLFLSLVLALLIPGLTFAGSKFNDNYTEYSFNARNVVTKTASYTATLSDSYIKVTASTAALTITLPAISTLGTNNYSSKAYKILKTDATAHHIIVSPSSTANTIDGTTGYRVTKQNDFIVFYAMAGSTDWKVSYADDIVDTNVASGVVTIGGTVSLLVSNESTTTTDALTASQCGGVITLNSATGYVTTLPAPTAGCEFTFYVNTQPTSGNHTVVTSGSSNVVYGSLEVAGAVVACATEDTVSFVASTVLTGDGIVVYSDGTSWFVSGDAAATGGITCTTAS